MTDALCIEPAGRVAVGNRLGEGIVWDSRSSAFLWTDIKERRLFRLFWPSLKLEQFTLPHRLGSFALTEDAGQLVAAFEQGFARYAFESDRCEWICRPPLPPGVRFNDGRVDRAGIFVAGTMVEDAGVSGNAKAGELYRLEQSGEATRLLTGIGISNALCWSPDGSVMYHADSTEGILNAYEYGDRPGPRLPLTQPPAPAVPDGATIDADGRIWVALWGGAQVAVYSPDGALLDHLSLPVSQPTCVALGGEAFDILAVTSAHDGLSGAKRADEPEAGNLLLFRTAVRGLDECRATP